MLSALILLGLVLGWILGLRRVGRIEDRLVDLQAQISALKGLVHPREAARTEPASAKVSPQVGVVRLPRWLEADPLTPSRPVSPPSPASSVEQAATPTSEADATSPSEVESPAAPVRDTEPTLESPSAPPARGAPPPVSEAPRHRLPEFDWESLLGLKGAAWAGGIALVIAGILLAKLAIDRGLITPELRVVLLLASGVGALVWTEMSRRQGYATTANAVAGAGIALLYIAFFAAHGRYHLVPLAPTFALMALVTLVAGLLAIRYDAIAVAGLGLLGGFATPLALSGDTDNPVGLFGYLILLNLGVLTVMRRMRQPLLAAFALAGTVLVEVMWIARFMEPEKTFVGLGGFLAIGFVYLGLFTGMRERAPWIVETGTIGAIVPFAFALVLAGDTAYVGEWPLLFGYLALLSAALIVVALIRKQVALLLGAAVATAITPSLWAVHGLPAGVIWGPTLSAVGLTVLLNSPVRLAARLAPAVLAESRFHLELTGVTSWAGLGVYGFFLISLGAGDPTWAFLGVLAVLAGLLWERGRPGRIRGVVVAGSIGLAILTQIWFFGHTEAASLSRNLAVPLLLSLALSLAGVGRRSVALQLAAVDLDDDELGVLGATVVAIAGLFLMLLNRAPWGTSAPSATFAALAVALVICLVSVLRRDWTELLLLELAAAAAFSTLWQGIAPPSTPGAALATYLAFYLGFLVLPFLLPTSLAPNWRVRPLPWVSSVLAGPAFFLVLYRTTVAGWGKAWIGLLPVSMAAASVAALGGVVRIFPARSGDPEAARRRLNFLALFAAVALGFIALAIPLQVDRQWIALGWMLEAAAVWWLFGRLPHPGLKYFGAVLFAAAGGRLLLDPGVLTYQERGAPIVNWILYTYGIAALSTFVGAWVLTKAEAARPATPEFDIMSGDRRYLAPAAAVLGLLLVFWLVNLEIFDYFSVGRYMDLGFQRHLARDLTMSVAWGLYALALLGLGIWRRLQPLRFASLAVLLLTVAKVFLYDLSALEGFYRILSFLGLGLSLILVSLLYQRFVFRRPAATS